MNKRTWSMLLIVVALLALLPHLPSWYPVARNALLAFRFAAILPPLVAVMQVSREWVIAHQQLAEIAGGILVLAIAATLALLRVRASARRRKVADDAVLVMPDRPVRRAGTTLVERTTLPQPIPVPVATEPRRPPRPSGVMQPAERESRRAMVSELFRNGRSVSEIARLTGIGQDAIRATVHEPRSA